MKKLHYNGFWINVPENADEHYSVTGSAPAKIRKTAENLERQGARVTSTVVVNSLRKEFNIVPVEIIDG